MAGIRGGGYQQKFQKFSFSITVLVVVSEGRHLSKAFLTILTGNSLYIFDFFTEVLKMVNMIN